MSVDARIRSRAHIAYAMGLPARRWTRCSYASGASSIQAHVPIQRFQRDVQALANHAIMHTQTALELYGASCAVCRRIPRSTDSPGIQCELTRRIASRHARDRLCRTSKRAVFVETFRVV